MLLARDLGASSRTGALTGGVSALELALTNRCVAACPRQGLFFSISLQLEPPARCLRRDKPTTNSE